MYTMLQTMKPNIKATDESTEEKIAKEWTLTLNAKFNANILSM